MKKAFGTFVVIVSAVLPATFALASSKLEAPRATVLVPIATNFEGAPISTARINRRLKLTNEQRLPRHTVISSGDKNPGAKFEATGQKMAAVTGSLTDDDIEALVEQSAKDPQPEVCFMGDPSAVAPIVTSLIGIVYPEKMKVQGWKVDAASGAVTIFAKLDGSAEVATSVIRVCGY